MAKDPRFNFYPDNWSGGTRRMTFEQKGAYMELIMLNFYCFSDGLMGFTEDEALNALVHATAPAEMWDFLKQKFQTDGKIFWSARMKKEFEKAQNYSRKQSERAKKKWDKANADATASPAGDACSGIGYGTGNGLKNKKESKKNVSRATIDQRITDALDEIYIEAQRMKWAHIDFDLELFGFIEKVRGSPDYYADHDTSGLRFAFQAQLRSAKKKTDRPKNKHDRDQQNLNDIAIILNHAAGGGQGTQ
jgi:uncharacterized protein YdaU (DUF1376 family)